MRPEHLRVAEVGWRDGPTASVRLVLEVLEPMGNEVFVYARIGGEVLVARVTPQLLPSPGEPIELAFDLRRLHFFDADGAVIREAPGVPV